VTTAALAAVQSFLNFINDVMDKNEMTAVSFFFAAR
jgi:hypothetical protein